MIDSMPIDSVRVLDAESLGVTVGGTVWTVPCRTDNGSIVVDSNSDIASAVAVWLASGNVPEPRPAPSLDSIKAAAKQAVAARADAIAESITGVVPLSERLSWPSKEAAARAVLGGTATSGQAGMIGAEATLAGVTPAQLAAVIVAKADRYMIAAGMISGLRRNTMAAIDALTNPETAAADVAAINAAAETQAAALLAQLNGQA